MPEKVLYSKSSLYQDITAAESRDRSIRYIFTSQREDKQGGIKLDAPDELLFEYTRMAFASLAFLGRDPGDALFIGLGAGSMPRYLNRYYPETQIDVAEVDPEVLTVAEKFFHYRERPAMKVHIADGRSYLKGAGKLFDMVFLDAYHQGDIPRHLSTVEFYREIRGKLRGEGLVVSNVLGPYLNKSFKRMMTTFCRVFPQVFVYEGEKTYNNIVIASTAGARLDKKTLSARARRIQAERGLDIMLPKLVAKKFYRPRPRRANAVLTDRAIRTQK